MKKLFYTLLVLVLGLLWSGNAIAEECVQGNCKNGQGTYTWSNGDKYVGEYKDNQKHGKGTTIFANGNKYAGEWKDGKYNGQGTYTFADGEKYVGEYKNNKSHGQGTYTYSNGDKYVGEYKEGKYYGQGTYTFGNGAYNGDKYVGEFKDDKYYGQGTYTSANGKIKEGIWENDKLVREKSEIVRYEKIYNKCILENLKGQSDKEVIIIIKDACKNKASDPSVFDKLFK